VCLYSSCEVCNEYVLYVPVLILEIGPVRYIVIGKSNSSLNLGCNYVAMRQRKQLPPRFSESFGIFI
jgi:hypothetical protein